MSDLVCQRCGLASTYADAYIADQYRTCDGDKHDWVAPLHNDIDVVTG